MTQAPCKYRVEFQAGRSPFYHARVSHGHIADAAYWLRGLRRSGARYSLHKAGQAIVVHIDTGDVVEFMPYGQHHQCD